MKTMVVYHRADFDGIVSGAICEWALNMDDSSQPEMFGWDYGDPLPPPIAAVIATGNWGEYQRVYIVDICIDPLFKAVAEYKLSGCPIIWIDHHITSIEKWDVLNLHGFRMDGVAACRLCWQFCWCDEHSSPNKGAFIGRKVSEPKLVRLVGEHDVWDHRDPEALPLQFGLRSLEDAEFKLLLTNCFENVFGNNEYLDFVVQKGSVIQQYMAAQNEKAINSRGHVVRFAGVNFLMFNGHGNSQCFDKWRYGDHDACLLWSAKGSECKVSLYQSNPDVEVLPIAKAMKGGGHQGACGFVTDLHVMHRIVTGGLSEMNLDEHPKLL